MKQTAFVISPVRGKNPERYKSIIELLEKKFKVHWPLRDTNQENSGIGICEENRRAILNSDKVFIIWDGESSGSLFDLGVCFGMKINVIPICLPQRTKGKSFQNMIIDYHCKFSEII